MSELKVSQIPGLEIDYLDEVDKLHIIAHEITELDIDPLLLIYCGIDGASYRSAKKLPDRDEAFGYTYEEYDRIARNIDKYGSSTDRTPLDYALDNQGSPAILTYDSTMLQVQEGSAFGDLWIPKDSHVLADAAKALIFIA